MVRGAHVEGKADFLDLLWWLGARCYGRSDVSFALTAIVASLRISNADAGLIGTVTLLTSALGGWIAGALADKFGRVRTLQITILWFALFTLLCGFAQSYNQLLFFRALMGLGFGGEGAAGAVLMGEVITAGVILGRRAAGIHGLLRSPVCRGTANLPRGAASRHRDKK